MKLISTLPRANKINMCKPRRNELEIDFPACVEKIGYACTRADLAKLNTIHLVRASHNFARTQKFNTLVIAKPWCYESKFRAPIFLAKCGKTSNCLSSISKKKIYNNTYCLLSKKIDIHT